MSRFNKNGNGLSVEQERDWLSANATPVPSGEDRAEAPAAPASEATASTQKPDEGDNKQAEESKRRRGLRRNKKGDNENG